MSPQPIVPPGRVLGSRMAKPPTCPAWRFVSRARNWASRLVSCRKALPPPEEYRRSEAEGVLACRLGRPDEPAQPRLARRSQRWGALLGGSLGHERRLRAAVVSGGAPQVRFARAV